MSDPLGFDIEEEMTDAPARRGRGRPAGQKNAPPSRIEGSRLGGRNDAKRLDLRGHFGGKRGRPTTKEQQQALADEMWDAEQDVTCTALRKGFTVKQLAYMFELPRASVTRLLENVPELRMVRHNVPVYDLVAVIPWLFIRDLPWEEIVPKTKPEDLPKGLSVAFYAGLTARGEYMERAGQWYQRARIVELFQAVFSAQATSIKSLVAEQTTREGLSDASRKALEGWADEALGYMRKALIEVQQSRRTPSVLEDGSDIDPDREVGEDDPAVDTEAEPDRDTLDRAGDDA